MLLQNLNQCSESAQVNCNLGLFNDQEADPGWLKHGKKNAKCTKGAVRHLLCKELAPPTWRLLDESKGLSVCQISNFDSCNVRHYGN